MKPFDFSCKHDILIENDDGTMLPMDEPYYNATKVMDGTWCILSDGDYTFLVEGGDEALVIDSGYGCGNIREFCQTLTDKPVRNIVNTHYHFDHTANDAYFEKVYMTKETYPLATIPMNSFEGIYFPKDYDVEFIEEGSILDPGGRPLEGICVPNHTPGSIAFIDPTKRILFSGDEVMNYQVRVETTVEEVRDNFLKLEARRGDFDWICSGSNAIMPAGQIEEYIDLMNRVINGDMGEINPNYITSREPKRTPDGHIVYHRMAPRPVDKQVRDPEDAQYAHYVEDGGLTLYFDTRRVHKSSV